MTDSNINKMEGSTLIKVITDAAVEKTSGKYKGRAGVLILDGDGIVRHFYSEGLGNVTSNEGEYQALKLGVTLATAETASKKDADLELYTDSKLVFNQMLGNYRTKKAEFVTMQKSIKGICRPFKSTKMKWHRRNSDLAVLADFASKHPRRTRTIANFSVGKHVSVVIDKVANFLLKDEAKAEEEKKHG